VINIGRGSHGVFNSDSSSGYSVEVVYQPVTA